MEAFAISFAAVFVAELGDKSQLMALTFAARYRVLPVLVGLALATATTHGLSVLAGSLIGTALPTTPLRVAAGLVFLGFAVWTLREDDEDEAGDDAEGTPRVGRSVVVAVALAFFLSELGDKTMLTTITLATTQNPVVTWMGSTLGMLSADVLAMIVGGVLGARLPERAIRIGSTVAFALFGVLLLAEALLG